MPHFAVFEGSLPVLVYALHPEDKLLTFRKSVAGPCQVDGLHPVCLQVPLPDMQSYDVELEQLIGQLDVVPAVSFVVVVAAAVEFSVSSH